MRLIRTPLLPQRGSCPKPKARPSPNANERRSALPRGVVALPLWSGESASGRAREIFPEDQLAVQETAQRRVKSAVSRMAHLDARKPWTPAALVDRTQRGQAV
jgi:hypothetical protein